LRGIKPFCNKFVKQAVAMENKGEMFKKKLEELKSDSGFRIPEGYFDTLSSRISDRISSGETPRCKSARSIAYLRPNLALVAFFIGVAVIGYFSFQFLKENRGHVSLSDESVAEYISYYYAGMNDYEFFGFADEEVNEFIFGEPEYNNDAEIIEYLMLQEVDIHLIINEL